MSLIEKLYSFLILAAVLVGLGVGHFDFLRPYAEGAIVPLLVGMLYVTFLQIPFGEIKSAFKNVKFTFTSLLINFVWTPILAWLLATLFLADHPALFIGFIMLMVTPCTDWYLIFTGIAKGNVGLSTAILPLNLLLQVILLPFYLLSFGGTTGVIELTFLLKSVVIVLLIPFLLALFTRMLLRKKQDFAEQFISKFTILPIIFLSVAIAAMFASQGHLLLENLHLLWIIMLPLLLFFIINLFVSQKVGTMLNYTYATQVSLSLTTLARNSPIALAIAMTAFPEEPLIALALVIGPLLELPILAVISQILLFYGKEK